MSSRRRGRGHGSRGGAGTGAGNGSTGAVSSATGVSGAAAASGLLPVDRDATSLRSVDTSEDGTLHEAGGGASAAEDPQNVGGRSGPGRGGPGRNSAAPVRRVPRPRSGPRPQPPLGAEESIEGKASCTLAQMRRFIKSRPYVPVHELRRRFLIEGIEDEVNPMTSADGTLYVGLPEREAGFLGELIKAGEVGCELLLDPTSPAVVGVFPMRPVARQ